MNEAIKYTHFVYRPPENQGKCMAQNASIGVKFSNDIFLLESYLKQQKIEYKEEDLEDSPYGRGIRIRRE